MTERMPSIFFPSFCTIHHSHVTFRFRIVPQDNNTGGFFVAVLEKVADAEEDEKKEGNGEEADAQQAEAAALALGDDEGAVKPSEQKGDQEKQTRWQQRGAKGPSNEAETGAEGLQSFATHPTLAKQWNMLRSSTGSRFHAHISVILYLIVLTPMLWVGASSTSRTTSPIVTSW